MSDCCNPSASSTVHPHKRRCPRDGTECAEVSGRTVAHHIRQPWAWEDRSQRYFFCEDPACEVIYFGEDDSVILKSALRTPVGLKETSDDALVCYCFGVSKADALRDSSARDYVVTQTRQGLCSCETRNPSGRCCLKNFPPVRS